MWVTGSYDPELNLTYWGIGNAGPDYNADQRPGDNLYTASVVALDADTGKLRWHYQFTPHDRYDYDSVQVPVLADITWQGAPVKAMLWANRNGNFYVLDRATGKFLHGKPFVKVNWMSGFDANGRPIQTPQPAGLPTYPGDPGRHELVFAVLQPANEADVRVDVGRSTRTLRRHADRLRGGTRVRRRQSIRRSCRPRASRREIFPARPACRICGAARSTTGPTQPATAPCQAIDPITGDAKWKFGMFDVTDTGIFTTASDLLITGGREGYLQAFDARTGTLLWKTNLGAQMLNNPITYAVNGKQYVAAMGGLTLFTFALPN